MPSMSMDATPKTDFWHAHAVREIYTSFRHTVSYQNKNKSLSKFGKTANADQNVETTIWSGADYGAGVHPGTRTTNALDTLVSSSASDSGKEVKVEGHTIDGSGNLTFVVQTVTCLGQTEVPLPTPLRNATRMILQPSGDFTAPTAVAAGNITVFDNTAGSSSGVPTDPTAVDALILTGDAQTFKAATTISSKDYWVINGVIASLGSGNSNTVTCEIEMQFRDVKNGGAWRPFGMAFALRAGSTNNSIVDFYPNLIVPPNHDVRLVAISNTNNTTIEARIRGVLAVIIE